MPGTTPPSHRCAADADEIVSRSPLAAISIDQEGRIAAWNAQATELLGHREMDARQRSLEEILPCQDLFGNDYCFCSLHRMVREGRPLQGFEVQMPRKTGEYLRVVVDHQVFLGPAPHEYRIILFVTPVRRRRRSDFGGEIATRAQLPVAAAAASQKASGRQEPQRVGRLTVREVEVLRELSAGMKVPEIASLLGIQPITVRNHIQRILGKLGVKSRVEAVSLALRRRIV